MSTHSKGEIQSQCNRQLNGNVIEEKVPVAEYDFPEGGLAGWATVFGAFLVQICSYGYTISFGVYQDYYTQTYLTNESSSTISWIGSINAFLFEICGLISGRLYDRGYFYHLVIGGSLLQSFSIFMLSLAKPDQFYQIFLTQGILSGCAAGILYIPSVAVVSHYFERRRALAMTFVASGACLGSVIHPIMLNNTLNSKLGFANSVRASAGLISGLLTIACMLMRSRLSTPESTVNYFLTAKKCYHDSAYVFGTAGLTIFVVAFYYPLFYLQLDSSVHGLNQTFSFYSLVIMNTSSFVGQLTSGFLADYFGVASIVVLSTFGCSVLLFAMIGVRTLASVAIFGVIYGYFAGTFLALWAPMLEVLTPDLSEFGARMGIACAIMAFGGLIGTPISGALLGGNHMWWRAALFNGIIGSGGCLLFFAMRIVLHRRQVEERSAPRLPGS
ncbi:MFS general substrate transporter [Leucogyrophana mollusca]|uniref:MFS general substrate transporter n=1 Tax=Leucogyrophana mollusca TaxID=85980 RepID=A0ACB8BD36_9AGAM|nr:MFS general substrate transporter [Leucogyrophana mollusca]